MGRPLGLSLVAASVCSLFLNGCGGGGGSIPQGPQGATQGGVSVPAGGAVSAGPQGAQPTASPAPKPSSAGSGTAPTATPSPRPVSSAPAPGLSDANYTQILDPGPWPANFRPYCANASPNPAAPCPWNDPLPDSPQQLYPNSASIVAGMFSSGSLSLPGDWSLGGDYDHPTYFASSSDPLVTVTCTAYCGIASATIHIPSAARAAGYFQQSPSLDGHMAIIEPDGTEYDMYHALAYAGQSSFSVGGLYETSVLGSGSVPGGGATSGAALAAGVIRADELARGVVPHALFASTNCVSGSYVYPGGSQGSGCSGGVGPPIGARLQLTLSDAQIDALGLPAWEAAILHAMHDYGVYILDTQGGGSPGGLYFRFESVTQYYAYGQPYPYSSMNLNLAGFDSALNWGQYFRIVSPCYAQETCAQ
jgi:hypothetical protein